ncbi:hypothetical protein OX284_014190 [Flavobacterium sp. SUN046]|uniref:hypothetical protein n=1 Tax=Flavobacterium sp. SUN046 TaxID=3002440 RepID=UPI002DB74344|nr:hypothetical protein [Flavobacterium sp. SUN046]MEC4050585.1 hypothetical protein [Flavobacterium sp. SUN046]
MTLKEQFNNLVPKEFGGMQEPILSECEKISDDFAIGFADYLRILALNDTLDLKTLPELLEIYKKENGL